VSNDLSIIKLVDFGVSVISTHSKISQTNKGGSPYFMSPEQAIKGKIGPKSDIYSFGYLLYYLFCHEIPWKDLSTMQILTHFSKGETPPIDNEKISDNCKEVIKQCVKFDPDIRPNPKELVQILKNIKHNISL